MNYKTSEAPTLEQLAQGWYTDDAKDITNTFKVHGFLLLFLVSLEIIPKEYFWILQRDFEHKTWSKIRDGE